MYVFPFSGLWNFRVRVKNINVQKHIVLFITIFLIYFLDIVKVCLFSAKEIFLSLWYISLQSSLLI